MIYKETLNLLEWHRLCQQLATFAATKMGATAARNLPIPTSLQESKELLAQTQEIYGLEQNLEIKWTFEGITDVGDSLTRATLKGNLSGQELLNIATTLAGMRRLRRIIDDCEDLPVLTDLVADIRTYPELEKAIHHCIDEAGKVADRASPKLGEIRHNLKEIRDRIYEKLQNIMQQKGGAIQETVITQRGDRFVLPVKAGQKEQIPGIIHDTSGTGGTFYIEPNSVVQMGNKRRQYLRQEEREEEAILRSLTEQVAEVAEDLEYLLAIATVLDLATARARYSFWLGGNAPRFIEDTETITLRQLHHPLLVWQERHEQGSPVVPINVQINPDIRVIAITGPNTGGKTVTLKTVGLAALMAKVGLFVPAKEPVELPWFEQILADIGDEQSIEQNLSTFSGHIRRIVRILEALEGTGDPPLTNGGGEQKTVLSETPHTPHPSLILLDEVGAGTDPAEGSALAIALLHHLADHAQLTIATTHYGELKALKYEDSRFENASVEFDDRTLSPTYRLLWGIPGRSNALSIAQRLGLDVDIIDEAKTRIGGLSQDVNDVIAGLEAQRREQEEKAQEAQKLLQETEKFYTEVSEKATALQQREQDLKRYQEQEVQKAIAEAKEEIAQVIRSLQKGKKSSQKAQQATEAITNISQRQLPKKAKPKVSYQPQVGEKIRLSNLGQTAEVLAVSPEDEEVMVRFGLMKMTVSFKDIESLDGQKVETKVKEKKQPITPPPQPSKPKDVPAIRTSRNTIDIRGSRVAEAEADLENAIAQATESGVLWIIHGKGTGKLRQGVHEFLKGHPQIHRFELASQKEGGSGVTLAYFK
ncbi:DNA mismatch repair protein [Crocosphaera subtropica ATCC 51142]|uniref:Endonuclease MutS2 n=1 Tax=Crocosphaera subtropica (strain ATCC 51142 / BH68) TaxID=43989 RepID=B1X0E9_CROS5|nr:endonuclease MutS2 [Crocosphaera subtropica]ACB51238.1 DNA mismatch repair protein [Crocosphaera subtropica ATCC 51142]